MAHDDDTPEALQPVQAHYIKASSADLSFLLYHIILNKSK